jgi:hypothetical protein
MKGPATVCFFHSCLTVFSQMALLLSRLFRRIPSCTTDDSFQVMPIYGRIISDVIRSYDVIMATNVTMFALFIV